MPDGFRNAACPQIEPSSVPAAEPRSAGGFFAWMMAPERRGPYLVAPAIIVLFVMNIFPLMWSFGLSFYRYRANRLAPPEFAWFRNYERILTDDTVWERFQTTAVIVASSVLLQLIIGFLLALLFEKEFPLRRILLMLVLTPMMLSFVAVGVFFKLFYEPTFGLLSQTIGSFTGEPFVLLVDTGRRAARASSSPMPGCGRPSSCCWCWPGWSACRNTSTRRRRSTGRRGGANSPPSPSPISAACCCWRSCSAPSRPSSCSTWST